MVVRVYIIQFIWLNSYNLTFNLEYQAIQYLERMLSQAHQQAKNEPESQDKGIDIDPKTYCKLGHFNLLIEDYAKGELTIFLWYRLGLTLPSLCFQLYPLIRNFAPFDQITGRTPTISTDWALFTSTTMHTTGEIFSL